MKHSLNGVTCRINHLNLIHQHIFITLLLTMEIIGIQIQHRLIITGTKITMIVMVK
nr:MAG TPA: hypothetical protein [Caudoviricetes sp.]